MLMALVCLIFAAGAEGRQRIAARMPFDTRRILWIAAHPDDELLIAPLLGSLCVEAASQCSIIVATRGENGPCELPAGCTDLGTLREQEMRAAAAMFRATLTQWMYPDAMSGFDTAWPHDEIEAKLRGEIALARPTVIITFDPRHGSTLHPAHELIGALALEASADVDVWMVETIASLSDRYHFAPAGPAIAIDARRTWHYLTDDAALHATQFSTDTLTSLRSTPDGERVVYLARH